MPRSLTTFCRDLSVFLLVIFLALIAGPLLEQMQ